MAKLLIGDERRRALADLKGWVDVEDRDAITKKFKFENFQKAWSFMTEVALIAEKMDHHPEWSNVYNRVDVTLTTHSVKGLSDLDAELAQKMDAISKT